MSELSFAERYKIAERALWNETRQQIRDGELSEDEADFWFYMVRDEILEEME